MTEPDKSYAVVVLGVACEHRWRGTVHVDSSAGLVLGRFTLDVDDATCPECGGKAGTVLFGDNHGTGL